MYIVSQTESGTRGNTKCSSYLLHSRALSVILNVGQLEKFLCCFALFSTSAPCWHKIKRFRFCGKERGDIRTENVEIRAKLTYESFEAVRNKRFARQYNGERLGR